MQPILPVERVSVACPASMDEAGPAPQLEWIAIARLVVDPAYQRPVTEVGRRNIRKIAEGFRWQSFSPVVVAPVAGGVYAIVDGQHRTTAAALCGFETVPCQIILATRGGQAEAFAAINGVQTRMHSIQVHKAAVAARDPMALAVETVCKRADCVVLRHPVPVLRQAAGETMAVGTIAAIIARHGEDLAVLTLRCIREGGNDGPGMLIKPIIDAVALCLASRLHVRGTTDGLLEGFRDIRILRELDRAQTEARSGGVQLTKALSARLLARLAAGQARAA